MFGQTHKILLLVVAALAISFQATAQEAAIKLPIATLSASEVFDNIHRQTDYLIATDNNRAINDMSVQITHSPVAINAVLDMLLAGSELGYRTNDHYIIITKRPATQKRSEAAPSAVSSQTADVYSPNAIVEPDIAPQPEAVPDVIVTPAPTPAPAPVVVVEPAPQPQRQYEQSSRYEPVNRYATSQRKLPLVGLKINLLYAGLAFAPNLGIEVGLGRRTSLELAAGFNVWNLKGSLENNRKLAHWIIKPGFRYWLCERYNGHFFGADLIIARYNIGTYNIPLLFKKQYRYYGMAYGGGVNYGYHLMLGKRWGLEFVVGVGVIGLNYDRHDCAACRRESTRGKAIYFGPTNAGINLVFLIK